MPGSVAAGRGANASLLAGIKNVIPYSPTGASGLIYRLRASSLTGYKHGDGISSVTSEVGALTLTQSTGSNIPTYIANGLNNKPAIRFDGIDDCLSGSIASTSLPLTFVVIMNLRSVASDQQVFYSGGPELLTINSGANWQIYNSSSGLSGGSPAIGGQAVIATFPASGSASLYINGTQAISGTLNAGSMTTFTLGCRSQGNKHLKADVYEILVYSGSFSATDRARIDSYAQTTYGITTSDSRLTLGDAPSLITGMTARYRADQVTGVTSGNAAASWPDASGNFYDAVQSTGANQPTWVSGVLNGQPVVRFNGTSHYMLSLAPSNDSQQTLIAVMKYTSTSQHMTIRSSSANNGLQFRVESSQKLQLVKQNNTNIATSTALTPVNTYAAVAATYAANSGAYSFRLNGLLIGAGSTGQYFEATTTAIGYNPSTTSEYLAGDIAELICYNRALSPVELRLIESYIQDRYALAVADYYIDDAINQIGGVTARYRADKIVGVADGSAVATWPDCSSNNNPAIQATAANQPALVLNSMNGQPVVRFNGSSHVLATAATTWGPNYTVFVVHKYNSFSANTGPIGNDFTNATSGTTSQRVFQLTYPSSTQLKGLSFYGAGASNDTDTVAATTSGAAVASITRSDTSVEVTFNGLSDGNTNTANAGTSTTNGQLTIGAVRQAAGYFSGDIAEVIVFNRALSSAERSQVHTYMSGLYGITVADVYISDTVSVIPGLQARYRADTILNVANTGAVLSWGDSSGNGYAAINSNLGTVPTFNTSVINSQPVVHFNNNQYLVTSMPSITRTSTVIAVMRYSAVGGNQTIISGSQTGSYQLCLIASGKAELVKSITAVIGANTTAMPANTFTALATTYDPAGPYTFTMNGTAGTSSSAAYSLVAAPQTYIGTNGATISEGLTGDIAELLIFNRILGSYEIAQIDMYINARYGMTMTDKITQIASEAFTTADSASWPSQWTMSMGGSNASYRLENGQGVILSTDTSSYAKAYFSGSPTFTNGGVCFKVVFPNAIDYSFTNLYINLSTDGTGSFNDNSSYSFVLRIELGRYLAMNIYKFVNGTMTTNMTYAFAPVDGPVFSVRCERVGANLRFKIWPFGSSEPGQWTTSATDASGSPLGAGSISLVNRSLSSVGGPAFIDDVSVYIIG